MGEWTKYKTSMNRSNSAQGKPTEGVILERREGKLDRNLEAAQTDLDCLSCRVIGTAACWGSGAWIAFHVQGAKGLHRGVGVAASSGSFVLGVVRAFMS